MGFQCRRSDIADVAGPIGRVANVTLWKTCGGTVSIVAIHAQKTFLTMLFQVADGGL
jgi:hypothetical protein